ncbi:MAG: YggT family protein [Candidatus Omnitrophica bacterium]|nr:YggT family protein [Candidatus Omnitrophota bacterium]
MFILAQLFSSLAALVSLLCNVVYVLLIARIIVSWVNADPYNEIVRVIYSVTEPMLAPFRRLPLQVGSIDFSPILAFILLSFLKNFMVGVLLSMAARLGG